MSNRLVVSGVAAVVVGMLLLFGQSFASNGTGTAFAGLSTTSPTSIPPTTAPATSTPARSTSTPDPSETPERLKTHTPSPTSTAEPTKPPATEAATNTAIATSTRAPQSGNEGVSVKPPNTGSGSGSASGGGMNWLIGLGALLVALGGGAALVGVKQRH